MSVVVASEAEHRYGEMSGKESDSTESVTPGISAEVLNELEERLMERIRRRMPPRDVEEGSSRQASGGGEWAIIVGNKWSDAEPS